MPRICVKQGRCNHLSSTLLSCVAASAFMAETGISSVNAQEPNIAANTEQIIVTARRKAENLQETPIAIAAFTAEEIKVRNLQNLDDLGSFTPNVDFSTGTVDIGGAGNAVFFIRGIGQVDYAPSFDPGVGLYVDGVYIGRSVGAILELPDVAQIEVLKGPQGTLFGKNTMGGAINITTVMPTEDFTGGLDLTYGEDNRFNVNADIGGPLNDIFSFRASAAYRSQDGFVNRPNAGDKAGEEGTFVSRLKLQADFGQTTVLLSGDFTSISADANLAFHPFYDVASAGLATLWNNFVGIPSGTPLSSADASPDDPRLNFGIASNEADYDGWGVALKVEHDFGGPVLRSVTSARGFEARNVREADGSVANFAILDYSDEQWQITQEVLLFGNAFDDRLSYTIGGFFMKEDAKGSWDVLLAPGLFEAFEGLPGPVIPLVPGFACPSMIPMAPCAGGAGNPLNLAFDLLQQIRPDIETTSYAVFGEAEYQITDQVAVFAGLRFTRDQKDYQVETLRLSGRPPIVPLTMASDSWNDVSPRIGIKYQPSDDMLVYATVSKGFKSGGFNARPANVFFAQRPFDPETVWAYEAGFKSDLAGGRVRFNGAAFYYSYRDQQLQANGVAPGDVNPAQFTDNIGRSRIWGLEGDVTVSVTDQFTVLSGFGYLNAQYKETGQDITGLSLDTELQKAPEWTANAAAQYVQPLDDYGELLARVDVAYTAENFPDARNTPSLRQRGHVLVNARIGWASPDERYSVALYARNLFDTKFIVNGFDVSAFEGSVLAIPSQPREVGITAGIRF